MHASMMATHHDTVPPQPELPQQWWRAVETLLHFVDITLVSAIFAFGRACLDFIPAQLAILSVLLWATAVKLAVFDSWQVGSCQHCKGHGPNA